MKLKSLSVLVLALSLVTSAGYAMERLSVEPALTPSETVSSDAFRAIVTGDGKLLMKPGAVFSDGGKHEGMELPYLLSNPKPINYPRWALRQGWQGDFSIAVEILTDGRTGRYKVMQSTGYEILDEAATEAVKTWVFHPAMKDGQPVVTCIQIPVRFQIDHKE